MDGTGALALAARGGERAIVSLSHDGEYAAAVVAVLSDTKHGGCDEKSGA